MFHAISPICSLLKVQSFSSNFLERERVHVYGIDQKAGYLFSCWKLQSFRKINKISDVYGLVLKFHLFMSSKRFFKTNFPAFHFTNGRQRSRNKFKLNKC